MTGVFLRAKLHLPRPRSTLVARPRLYRRLDSGLERRLTLVSAPAGYGKTTLVAAWAADLLERHAGGVAWLSLDEGDNDLGRFLSYTVRALRLAVGSGDLGEAALASPATPQDLPIRPFLSLLVNELAAFLDKVVLVLDDYHEIRSPGLHDVVSFLMENAPPHLHLVLVSREDPPFPLARLRLLGELNELRARELSFAGGETADFFRAMRQHELSPAQVEELEEHTEGWVAALQAVALSLSHGRSLTRVLGGFGGSHRFVLDYLTEEVLLRQPEAIRTFLCRTAILERLSAPLSEAVTGDRGAQETLERLERSNLFIVPLDDQREWYRYHPLFRDFLQTVVKRKSAAQFPELHRRAAAWHEENTLFDAAITHWLAAGEPGRAADLLEVHARDMVMRGESGRVRRSMEALPEELIRSRPRLCLAHAVSLTFVRDLERIEERLDLVEAFGRDEDTDPAQGRFFLGAAATYRAMLTHWRGADKKTIELCREARTLLAEDESYLRGLATYILGMTHLGRNDLDKAARAIREALETGEKTHDLMLTRTAAESLGAAYELQGRLTLAADLYRRTLAALRGEDGRRTPMAAALLTGLARVECEREQLSAAAELLEEAVGLAKRSGLPVVLFQAYAAQVRVFSRQCEWEAARAALSQAETLAPEVRLPNLREHLDVLRVDLCLAHGDREPARRWARGNQLDPEGDIGAGEERKFVVLAKVLLASAEEHPEALGTARRLLLGLAERARTGPLPICLEIHLLRARVHDALGETSEALAALDEALELGKREGCVAVFADGGPVVARLLKEKGVGTDPSLLRLLAACRIRTRAGRRSAALPSGTTALPPLVRAEPLTARQLEVLGLIHGGLSNQEIAEELSIAVSTVKRHINHLYGKLEVGSRTQALARARQLKLLDE